MIQKTRTVSWNQTLLSVVILSVLFIIGAAIFRAQFHFNPAVLERNAFLQEFDTAGPPSRLTAGKIFQPLTEGMQPLSPVEHFDRQSLSDKIDGKAELYLASGFKTLTSQRFKEENDPDSWMEAFVYDMGSGRNAFSVFSTQRRQNARSLDLTQNAYRTSNALFFTHGPYYVEMIASKGFDNLPTPISAMAQAFIGNTPLDKGSETAGESNLFPKEGLVRNSISLIAANAFGYDGFDKIYTAEYQLKGHTLMAFLSRRKTPQKAEEMASAYSAFILAFGGKRIEPRLSIKGSQVVEVMDTFEIIFSHGPYLAGVREAVDSDTAEILAERLYDRLKE